MEHFLHTVMIIGDFPCLDLAGLFSKTIERIGFPLLDDVMGTRMPVL